MWKWRNFVMLNSSLFLLYKIRYATCYIVPYSPLKEALQVRLFHSM